MSAFEMGISFYKQGFPIEQNPYAAVWEEKPNLPYLAFRRGWSTACLVDATEEEQYNNGGVLYAK